MVRILPGDVNFKGGVLLVEAPEIDILEDLQFLGSQFRNRLTSVHPLPFIRLTSAPPRGNRLTSGLSFPSKKPRKEHD
jgi:hypothetical protein